MKTREKSQRISNRHQTADFLKKQFEIDPIVTKKQPEAKKQLPLNTKVKPTWSNIEHDFPNSRRSHRIKEKPKYQVELRNPNKKDRISHQREEQQYEQQQLQREEEEIAGTKAKKNAKKNIDLPVTKHSKIKIIPNEKNSQEVEPVEQFKTKIIVLPDNYSQLDSPQLSTIQLKKECKTNEKLDAKIQDQGECIVSFEFDSNTILEYNQRLLLGQGRLPGDKIDKVAQVWFSKEQKELMGRVKWKERKLRADTYRPKDSVYPTNIIARTQPQPLIKYYKNNITIRKSTSGTTALAQAI